MEHITRHAGRRMQQRGICAASVSLILDHAVPIHSGGAEFYVLRKRDIPAHVPAALKDRLAGTTVVVQPDTREVITVYRNRNALRSIRRKADFGYRFTLRDERRAA